MAPIKYLTPFAFLALLPLGAWLGGAWTIAAAAAIPLGLAILDETLGVAAFAPAASGRLPRWLPRAYVILQLAANGLVAAWVLRPGTGLTEAVGLALLCGLTTGIFGFVAAHELIHSPDSEER